MTDEEQARHAQLFADASRKLAALAGAMQRTKETPRLDPIDVAGLFFGTAVNILQFHGGPRAALSYLREMLAALEAAEQSPPRVN